MIRDGALKDQLVEQLEETLGVDGWRIRRTRSGVRCRWRWLSVTFKEKNAKNPDQPWRTRLREVFPPNTITEQWTSDPLESLSVVVERARLARRFTDGELGLVPNPSKSWLSYRVWQAVRPIDH